MSTTACGTLAAAGGGGAEAGAPGLTYVALGPTGTGKSTLINTMLGLKGAAKLKISAGANSETAQTIIKRGHLPGGEACTMIGDADVH